MQCATSHDCRAVAAAGAPGNRQKVRVCFELLFVAVTGQLLLFKAVSTVERPPSQSELLPR